MSRSLLRKLFGSAGEPAATTEAFSLPGALHAGVRLLLVASDDVTDLLFAMPFVEKVLETVEGAEVGLVCDERTSHLALSTDLFAEVLVVEDEHLRSGSPARKGLESVLSQEKWDVAVMVGHQPDPSRDEFALLSGATLRLGPGHAKAYPNLNCEVRPPVGKSYPYARTATWGRLLGVALEDAPLRWPIAEKRDRQMAQLVHFNKPRPDQRLIAFDSGVGKTGARIGAESLAFVANHLLSHIPSKGILLTADDAHDEDDLRRRLHGDLLELPRPTLLETVLLLKQCDLLVSGNTDLFHFAGAVGVPSLGIFTPADEDRWVPSRATSSAVMRPEPGQALDLAEVMERIEGLLR